MLYLTPDERTALARPLNHYTTSKTEKAIIEAARGPSGS